MVLLFVRLFDGCVLSRVVTGTVQCMSFTAMHESFESKHMLFVQLFDGCVLSRVGTVTVQCMSFAAMHESFEGKHIYLCL